MGNGISEENSPRGLAIQSYPAVFWDTMAVDLPGSNRLQSQALRIWEFVEFVQN